MDQDLKILNTQLNDARIKYQENLQGRIQLAQAEELQGIRKALEGILEEMEKPKTPFERFIASVNRKDVPEFKGPD